MDVKIRIKNLDELTEKINHAKKAAKALKDALAELEELLETKELAASTEITKVCGERNLP